MPAVTGLSVLALLVAFWLRASATALTRVPRADALRDASDGVPGAAKVAALLEDREIINPAVGVAASALLVLSAVLGVAVFSDDRDAGETLGMALVVGMVVFLVGDLIPRGVGRRASRPLAYRSARAIAVAIAVGGWANDLLPEEEVDDPEAQEIEDESDEQERDMIDSVLEFGETIVREVMTPRPDMTSVEVTARLDELVTRASEAGFSRIPVTSEGDVVGLVIVKDLLPALSEGHKPLLAEVMRPVEFVPETKLASSLLAEMQESHTHMVVVVDEYGDVAGLVTIEDLLEELVGEIADETDEEETFIVANGEQNWVVDARLAVDDLADAAGIELPGEAWDTVGGLVMGLAERVPEEGETFAHGGLALTVLKMQGRRVSEVEVSVDEVVDS